MRLLVGRGAELDTFSLIRSAAGSPDQPWHVDVDARGELHQGLVAVVPLAPPTPATHFISHEGG